MIVSAQSVDPFNVCIDFFPKNKKIMPVPDMIFKDSDPFNVKIQLSVISVLQA